MPQATKHMATKHMATKHMAMRRHGHATVLEVLDVSVGLGLGASGLLLRQLSWVKHSKHSKHSKL